MKKQTIKQLKNKLWALTSRIVRLQSDRCYTCNSHIPDMRDRQAGHFWSRGGHGATYFDLDNLRVQDAACNNWKSGNLAEYAVKLRSEIGDDRFNALAERAHQIKKWDRQELIALIEERKQIVSQME